MIELCKWIFLLMVIYSLATVVRANGIQCRSKSLTNAVGDEVFDYDCSSLNVTWKTINAINNVESTYNIDLSNNSFYEETDGTIIDYGFNNLKNLQKGLYLRSNKFKSAGKRAFYRNSDTPDDMLQVKLIDLSDNEFEIFPMEALISLKYLNVLDLSFNRIKSIELDDSLTNAIQNNEFIPFKNLTELHLRNCSLSYLNLTVFKLIFKNLKYLDVSYNKLFALESTFLDIYPLNSGFRLNIDKNPLYCDCKILWLKKYLVATNQSSSATTCRIKHDANDNSNKYDLSMFDMVDEEFICEFDVTLTNTIPDYYKSYHHEITLRCNVKSYPEPLIDWKFGSKSLPKTTNDQSKDLKYAITTRKIDQPSADFKDKQLYHIESNLTIRSLDDTDSGNYTCSVSFHMRMSNGDKKTAAEIRLQERLNHTSQKLLYLKFPSRPDVSALVTTAAVAIRIGSSSFFRWLIICVCVTVSLIIILSLFIFFMYRCRRSKKNKKLKALENEKYNEIQVHKIREHNDTHTWKTYSSRRHKSLSSSHDESRDEDAISSIYAPNGHNIDEEQSSDTESDDLNDYRDPTLVNLR